jgi:hypothetical protein
MHLLRIKNVVFVFLAIFFLASCDGAPKTSVNTEHRAGGTEVLTVYKSRSCGCCEKWIDHIESEDIEVRVKHPSSMKAIKDRYHIAPKLRSCHTAVSLQGYVFEGHVPERFIQQFLANPPTDARGLAVPAMPLGSPGMEVGKKFRPYQILKVNTDGSTEVFARVENQAEQYQSSREQEVQL